MDQLNKTKMKETNVEKGRKKQGMSRKDAIKNTGFIALSAATMMLLLSNPQKANAAETSPANAPRWRS